MNFFKASCAVLLTAVFIAAIPVLSSPSADRQPITEALRWVRSTPAHIAQYDYIMTVRVRMLFFWLGKDDVGGGYVRRGISSADPHQEFFQVLFGSDPAKTPRAINRWGAGTEVSFHKNPVVAQSLQDDITASAFFGFMKSSGGKSVAAMQEELKKEKDQGQHAFTGILSRVEPTSAISLVVPLQSDTDYNFNQYDLAEPIMLSHLANSSQPLHSLQDSSRCARADEFLASVAELMDVALAGQQVPLSRCYIYNSQENMLTLSDVSPVSDLPVQLHGPADSVLLNTSYKHLLQLDFVSTHKETSKKVYFSVLVGTEGTLRGVPVQIRYQPNWWFQIVLNLRPATVATSPNTVALK